MTTRDGQPLFLVDRLSPSDDVGPGISAAVAARHARGQRGAKGRRADARLHGTPVRRSEEHPSELQSLMRISYAVFCLKKKKLNTKIYQYQHSTVIKYKIQSLTQQTNTSKQTQTQV